MTKIKILKNLLLIVLTFAVIFGLDYYLRENNFLFYSSGTKERAFINATWEMSPHEVQRANNVNLTPAKNNFFNLPDQDKYEYPRVINMERYKLLDQTKYITLWSFETKVEYAFFDEKLFECAMLLEGCDSNKMHKKITSALTEEYGDGVAEDSKTYLHSMHWETTSVRVRYWLLEKEGKGNVKLFLAGVRISYKPMHEIISKISLNKHKK